MSNMLKVELYQHQKEALRRLNENRSYALFMEQGTGKTLPTLCHITNLLVSGTITNALIVCPLAVMGSWLRDMNLFLSYYQMILREHVTVINYDIIWRRPEYLCHWGCVVLDESHAIKNRGSRRSKYLRQLNKLADYRYILTGTPIGNGRLEEIWAQYNFLNPDIFGAKFKAFEDRYCILDKFFKPCVYQHKDEIREKIFSCAYRVRKIDCLDLPDKLPSEAMHLDLYEKAMYKEMLNNYIIELDIEASNPLARLVKLRSLCSGFIKDEEGTSIAVKCGKPAALRELLDNWDEKLVIFAEFRSSIKTICAILDDLKITYITLDGEQKDKTIWKRFQMASDVQVIVCQYRTASAGIDLYAANTILFYEPTLSSQINEQAKDRIHRSGQRQVCAYLYFVTKGTIEQRIYTALENHADFSEKLLMQYVSENRKGVTSLI